MSSGFTKIDNCIIENENLSFDAKGIYMILARYISIPNFKINKTHIKSVTGLGEIRFNRAWKELKENGLLIQVKKSVSGKFEYDYSLSTVRQTNATAPVGEKPKKKEIKHIDSDGNEPLDGQIYIDDVKTVVEATGLNKEQSEELLKTADNNLTKVIESHKYVKQQSGVRNIFGYIKWAIKNISGITSVTTGPRTPKGIFNNFPQRTYDFDELERALLYGEPYGLST